MQETKLCRVCQSPFSNEFTFREMMFGFRDEFIYYECSRCGCLQIEEVPADIVKYYPPYYYSFNLKTPELKKKVTGIAGIIDQLLLKKRERKSRRQLQGYLSPMNISRQDKILDVGCGKGEVICRLFNMGYESVQGSDIFLPKDINYDFGVKVSKKPLQEIEQNTFDLIMMHHVFEHMAHPEEELRECFRILKNKSFLMIRIPVKGFAWEKYKENWVQLDPPRHFFIHTLESMNLLAEETGFDIRNVVFDSTAFQFEGSELYKRNIPLYHPDTHEFYPSKTILSKQQRSDFKKQAKNLNDSKRGDQAIFYLYKP
jgi:predicted SAM-dependent methyltransferase